jgi:hypothetical protein
MKRSDDVKKKIAELRYKIYTEIIDYIGTWHAIKSEADFALGCTGESMHHLLEMNIFDHRLLSQADIANELEKIVSLTIYHYYLDKDTYAWLMYLERYLFSVNEYAKRTKIKHFNFFIYVVYFDIHYMVCKIADCIREYLIRQDTLNYATSNNALQKNFKKLLEKTNFYNLFILGTENVKTEKTENKHLFYRIKQNIKQCCIKNMKNKNPLYRQMQECKKKIKDCKEKLYSKDCKLFKENETDWDI